MKVTIIHGQSHKGITYTMSNTLLKYLEGEEVREFFLPKDGPDFCYGCNNCFLKGEEKCPSADKVQPIVRAMEWADVIILDSPCYVMEMSGALKNLMDHLAYRWITHRPHGAMFKKVGITVCSSAGAPTRGVLKSMGRQLKWMGVPKVYHFGLMSNAMGVSDLKAVKLAEIEKRAKRISIRAKSRVAHPHVGIRGVAMFNIFKGMQSSEKSAWNPKDKDWWVSQGWTHKVRPWKSN